MQECEKPRQDPYVGLGGDHAPMRTKLGVQEPLLTAQPTVAAMELDDEDN